MHFSQRSFRKYLSFLKAYKRLWRYVVLGLSGALVAAIMIMTFLSVPLKTFAQSSTWTTTADFATWTLTNTEASNNSLVLASGGGSPSVTTKSAAFPSGGSGPAAVWDPAANLAYIFSGNNNDGNAGIYKYDPANDSLTAFTAEEPFNMEYSAAVWNPTAQKAYLFGTVSYGSGVGNEILVFDPAANAGGGSMTVLALTLPQTMYGAGAVWNDSAQKAYIFGGAGNVSGDQIFVFDPAANGGLGSITTLALTLPDRIAFNPAVWDSVNGQAYIFGSAWGNGDEIYVFDPAANGGLGSATTHSLTLPFYNQYESAAWDESNDKAYIFGGDGGGNGDEIVVFDPNASGGAGSVSTASVSLPSARNSGAAVWADSNGKSYFFQGWDPNFRSDEIIEFNPGGGGYAASGTATTIYTPLAGSTNLWQSATANTTLAGQTVTIQYTTNSDCSTGLTSTISSLSASESICIKATLATSDSATTPSLNDLTINYATYGQTETQTWTTTADFNTWTKTQTESLNNSLSLTYTDDVGQLMTQKSFILPRQLTYSASVFATNMEKFYLFGGANVTTLPQIYNTQREILEIDPSTKTVTKKTATLPVGIQEASAVWDSTNNVAYIFGGLEVVQGAPDVSTRQNAIYKYTPLTDTITTLTPTLPTARFLTSAVWDTDNNVAYIFGGDDASSSTLDTIITFDPAGNGGLGSVSTEAETLPYPTDSTSAVWNPTTSKAYIFGGYIFNGSQTVPTNEVIEYTPSTGLFRKASDGLPTFAAARERTTAAWDSSTNKAYIMGGFEVVDSDTNAYVKSIIEFNPAANSGNGSLTTKSAELPRGRFGIAGSFDPNTHLVYAFGGSFSDQIITYNPSSDTTAALSHTPINLWKPSAVYAPSEEKTYIFGGGDTSTSFTSPFQEEDLFAPVMEYDSTTNSTVIKTLFPGIHYGSSAVWNPTANEAYIFGGHDGTRLATNTTNKIYKYTPSTNSLVLMTPTLPSARELSAAVWDTANNVAYIFGGYNPTTEVMYDTIVKFDPAGNGGAGSITTLATTLPSVNYNMPAVWNPSTNKAYVFGGGVPLDQQGVVGYPNPGTGNDVVEFDPSASGGAGTATKVLDDVLGYNSDGAVAVWSLNRSRAYIIGLSANSAGRNIWEYNPVTNALREPLNPGGNGKMRYTFTEGAAAWNSDTDSAVIVGGIGNGIYANGTDGTETYNMDAISDYYPGRRVYDTPGTGTIVFTPSSGTNYIWQAISYNATLSSQTVNLEYTNNTDCATNLTSDISALEESESLCVKATLATSSESVTPTLDDVTVTYGIGITAPTPTPSPTPTTTATPSPTPSSTTTPTPTPSPTPSPSASPGGGGGGTSTPTPTPNPEESPTATPSPAPGTTPGSSPEPPPSLIKSFSPLVRSAPTIIGLIVLLTVGQPLVTLIPNLITGPQGWWWNVISGRKRKYALSRVTSSISNTGIPYVPVTLIRPDQNNPIIARAWSDKEGKFGFYTTPGNYKILIRSSAYEFPSRITTHGYHGDVFEVDASQIVQLEVPVDPVKLRNTFWQTLESWAMKLQWLRIPLLLLGTILTVINIPHVPLIVSILFMAYYASLWVWELSRTKYANHLITILDQNRRPMPFVRIDFEPLSSKNEPYYFITDSNGKAYVQTLRGTYQVTLHLRDGRVGHQETLELTYGVMPHPITWVMQNKDIGMETKQ